MKIDIDKLTEAELVELNRRIVERLRMIHQMKEHVAMMQFSVGERVSFQDNSGELVVGILAKYNKKTVTVVSETGHSWNVSPSFLQKHDGVQEPEEAMDNVIEITAARR